MKRQAELRITNYELQIKKIRFLSGFICVHLWIIFLSACSSQPTDLRNFAPADTLVYLETNDLGKALGALTESRAFQDAAKAKPDFSALSGIQTAIAVTGFEATETPVTAENSVLNFKPRFVAIADTHTWNRYTLSFTEERLGEFVNETYGGEVTLDTENKSGGKSFVWTAKDGRKVFAFVTGSRIFFSNDAAALEKSLAVSRGEADSLVKDEALAAKRETAAGALAFGYVSSDGIAQISNLAGVSTALKATDDDEGRSFIAQVLPKILRGAVKDVFWTATKTGQGIEDKYTVSLTPENASVVKETLVPAAPSTQSNAAEFLPADVFSATRYRLQNPQIAWRSLLLVAGKNADPGSAKILIAFAGSLLEPYVVADAETFLSAVDSEIWTAVLDAEGEKTVAVVQVKDAESLKKSIAEINFKAAGEKRETAEIWKSADGTSAAAFVENKLILGDTESVLKCLQAKQNGQNFTRNPAWKKFTETGAVAVTYGKDATEKVVEVLGEKKAENAQLLTNFSTETRFNASGIERRTVSPFGLIGRILEQFED
ncbi:MAG TPA: hypothetical protein VGC97_14390 [Pyrinomonadaceae bacterium]|jgi:hypothetical protein